MFPNSSTGGVWSSGGIAPSYRGDGLCLASRSLLGWSLDLLLCSPVFSWMWGLSLEPKIMNVNYKIWRLGTKRKKNCYIGCPQNKNNMRKGIIRFFIPSLSHPWLKLAHFPPPLWIFLTTTAFDFKSVLPDGNL